MEMAKYHIDISRINYCDKFVGIVITGMKNLQHDKKKFQRSGSALNLKKKKKYI